MTLVSTYRDISSRMRSVNHKPMSVPTSVGMYLRQLSKTPGAFPQGFHQSSGSFSDTQLLPVPLRTRAGAMLPHHWSISRKWWAGTQTSG
jgi:hypothetical protein